MLEISLKKFDLSLKIPCALCEKKKLLGNIKRKHINNVDVIVKHIYIKIYKFSIKVMGITLI